LAGYGDGFRGRCFDGFRNRLHGETVGFGLAILPRILPFGRLLRGTLTDILTGDVLVADLAGRLVAAGDRSFFKLVGLFRVFKLKEVGYIEEGVALQAYIYKCRLHAGQDAGYAAVIN
jgi:hypothetical protein